MYYPDRYDRPASPPRSGAYLTAEEIRDIAGMMEELRGLTLSRSTFKATSTFLARFAGETEAPSLVAGDLLAQ
jgi:hypothetical protein